MKRFLAMCAGAVAFKAGALITNNLAADWQGGVGITATGGRISQWNDQHQALNNDGLGPHHLTQGIAANQPYDITDAHGLRGAMLPWGTTNPDSLQHPKTHLNIPASLTGLSTTNLTVYVVATGPANPESQTLVWFTGLAAGWIAFSMPGNLPANLSVGSQSATIYPPLNRAVFVAAGAPALTTLRWNNVLQTNSPQAVATTGGGGRIGNFNGVDRTYYSGIIYRILVYRAAHTAAEMNAQVAELAAKYGVFTNFTRQAVCRGDSITAGVDSTMLQSYPFQLWQRYPEIVWRNHGIGGEKIGTNGTGMTSKDASFVDPLYDPALEQNWLLYFGGVNDINGDGMSGVATYGRLTNYVAVRKAAHPWRVIVSTVQNTTVAPSNVYAAFNSCIRTNAGGWDGYVDPGFGSPIETRLNNPANTNYFYWQGADAGLHLVNAGYTVIADHFGQIVNVPRRASGTFGP